jgi:hypothetical protein
MVLWQYTLVRGLMDGLWVALFEKRSYHILTKYIGADALDLASFQ